MLPNNRLRTPCAGPFLGHEVETVLLDRREDCLEGISDKNAGRDRNPARVDLFDRRVELVPAVIHYQPLNVFGVVRRAGEQLVRAGWFDDISDGQPRPVLMTPPHCTLEQPEVGLAIDVTEHVLEPFHVSSMAERRCACKRSGESYQTRFDMKGAGHQGFDVTTHLPSSFDLTMWKSRISWARNIRDTALC